MTTEDRIVRTEMQVRPANPNEPSRWVPAVLDLDNLDLMGAREALDSDGTVLMPVVGDGFVVRMTFDEFTEAYTRYKALAALDY